jgi:hypothetical protein
MITKKEAIERMHEYLRNLQKDSGQELVMVEDSTLEYSFGWVFFYEAKAFLLEGVRSARLAGNAPLIIDRRDGSFHETGTAYPIEFYVENYEKYGSPYPPNDYKK